MQSGPVLKTFDSFTLTLLTIPLMSGWFQYTLGPTADILRVEEGISRQLASLTGTMCALGGIIGALIVVRLVRVFGRRRLIVGGAVACGIGIVVLTLGNGFAWILGGVLAVAVARTLCMNSMSSALTIRHGAHTGTIFSYAYAIVSGAGILAPLALSVFLATGNGWRPGFFITFIFVTAIVIGMLLQPRSTVLDGIAVPGRRSAAVPRKLPLGAAWRWLLFIMCAIVSAEWATVYWSGDLIRSQTHAALPIAALGTSALLLGEFCGRITFGRLAHRWSPMHLIIFMIPLSIGGWAILWLSHTAMIALIGVLIMGVGISATFPLLMTLMIVHSRGQADRSIALSGLASALSSGLAPFALASLSDHIGPSLGFLFVPFGLVLALITAVTINRKLLRGP